MSLLPNTSRSPSVSVIGFDRAFATEHFALLRVGARWTTPAGAGGHAPALEVHRGGEVRRIAPLPQPEHTIDWRHADGRIWWAGYAVPIELADCDRTAYALAAPGMSVEIEIGTPGRLVCRHRGAVFVARRGRRQLLAMTALAAMAFSSAPTVAMALDSSPPTGSADATGVGQDNTAAPVQCPDGQTYDPAAAAAATAPTEGGDPAGCVPDPPAPKPTPTPEAPAEDAQPTTVPAPAAEVPPPAAAKKAPPPAAVSTPSSSPKPAPHRKPPRKDAVQPVAHHEDGRPGTKPSDRGSKPAAVVDHAPSGRAVQSPQPASGVLPAAPLATAAVPRRMLEQFDVPPFLLPIYQAAGTEYQVPWEVLAAINSVETDFGRNLNVSTAGAVGWMQFMPATWKTYGVDANLDGVRDPANPVDAIFAAARYLHAAGASDDLRRAVYAYNHADWYVNMVLARAASLRRLPTEMVDALTGLAQARFPVSGRVSYSRGSASGQWAVLHAGAGRQVVAVADGKVVAMGSDKSRGRFLVLRDAYGNRFTYADLGSLERRYATPAPQVLSAARIARELHLPRHDARPHLPATVGRPVASSRRRRVPESAARITSPSPPRRAVWNPADAAGASERHPGKIVLRALRPGARVVAGTRLGRVSTGARPVRFSVRPAGRDAPQVNPTPLLDGWRLLEGTSVFAPAGTSTLQSGARGRMSFGQTLLLDKDALARSVLADPRIKIYECGRNDIRSGVIDRRVLAVLAYLADSGLHPTVTSLHCGHSLMTASGNVSEHSTGDAVDVAAINGIPIVGHQGPGSITETTIRRLLELQGAMVPHQIISLMTFAGADNTLALPDHYDHIHIGYRADGGAGGPGVETLRPAQWRTLMTRLASVRNPVLLRQPSHWALRRRNRD